MTRTWEKLEEGNYAFAFNNQKVGEMQIALGSTEQKATCQLGNEHFTIKRTGFWKNTIEVQDNEHKTVAKIYSEKWYANSSILEYGDQKYKLILHNNPYAEYAIQDGSNTLLAYGLQAEKGRVSFKTTGDINNSNLLLDFLLWYLFVPIVTENMGDGFVFQLLLTAQ